MGTYVDDYNAARAAVASLMRLGNITESQREAVRDAHAMLGVGGDAEKAPARLRGALPNHLSAERAARTVESFLAAHKRVGG